MILVSCAGGDQKSLSLLERDETRERVLAAKRLGEETLRRSGISYSIIRPGPLVEEPGGYKALVFDQVGFSAFSPC